MKIIAKSSVIKEQIEDRYRKNFKYIEIQLLEDFMMPDFDIKTCYETILDNRWDIINVHVPLYNRDCLNLEYLGMKQYFDIFIKVCELSEGCAKYYKHSVNIIIHSNISFDMLSKLETPLIYFKEKFKDILEKYPDITFSFENITITKGVEKFIDFRECAHFQNVELAKGFNKLLNTNRFYTTLDICHLLSSMRIKKLIFGTDEGYTIREYFKANKDIINNIHLNNCLNYGFKKEEHGINFNTDKDIKLLEYILELYNNYNYTCPLTLEVYEKDYRNIVEMEKLKRMIEERIGKQE